MLNCRQISERASRFVDGELGRREWLAVRLHLLMCAKCRRFVQQLGCLVTALGRRSSQTPPAPAGVEQILSKLPLPDPGEQQPPEPPPR